MKKLFAFFRFSGKLPGIMSQQVFFQFKNSAFEFLGSIPQKKIADY